MKQVLSFLLLYFLFSPVLMAQNSAAVVSFEGYQKRAASSVKPITIVNFWATWCGPCIKELPHFEAVYAEKNDQIDLILVSLDFVEDIVKVNTFIQKKDLNGEVLLLDDIDYNSWIDRVNTSWSGAIPASLFINNVTGEQKFVEGEMTLEKINEILNQITP